MNTLIIISLVIILLFAVAFVAIYVINRLSFGSNQK